MKTSIFLVQPLALLMAPKNRRQKQTESQKQSNISCYDDEDEIFFSSLFAQAGSDLMQRRA